MLQFFRWLSLDSVPVVIFNFFQNDWQRLQQTLNCGLRSALLAKDICGMNIIN